MSKHLLVCAVAVALAGRATAETAAAAAFDAAMTAYSHGDYATAIVGFEAAFRSDPRAEVAFTLAQAHRNQYFIDKDVTHLHRALGLYRHYLAEQPNGRRAGHARLHLETIEAILATQPVTLPVPEVEKTQPTQLLLTADAADASAAVDGGTAHTVPVVVDVDAGSHRVHVVAPGHDPVDLEVLAIAQRLVVVPATLHARPAQLVVHTDANAQIAIDGRAAASTSSVTAGVHRVSITARGRMPVVRTIELDPGTSETLDIALEPTLRRRVAAWTLYGGAGLAGVAVIAATASLLAQHDATSIPPPPLRTTEDLDRYRRAVERRDTWRAVSIGFGVAAGATALTGAALWYFDLPRPRETTPVLVPIVGPESVGAEVVGRF